jgi:predicted amidohydrolase
VSHLVKLAVCQLKVLPEPSQNVENASALVAAATAQRADIVVLPEMFHIPYATKLMTRHAEEIPGLLTAKLSAMARENQVILIGGSIAEREGSRLYNTCVFFGPDGSMWGKFRKIHLFDVDIPGQVSFQESSVLSAGNEIVVKKTSSIDFSTLICYDARFPELFRIMSAYGVELIVIPASFSIPTGAAHWELTLRTRAIDHQVFIAAASSARNPDNGFQPFGHSMIIDPWGIVLAQAGTDQEIITADLDMDRLRVIRQELPLLAHTRQDLYTCSPSGLRVSVV